ncbi:MAG: GNAT family N-acetyltransferase [Lachnospiraceae bacterium]|jgi:diamine N-acetyltransferase|nr:GNAT family N-acetyltransferase [Lachnospiraceae bacterium]
MKLRKLKRKDAPLMLEWMHDPVVVGNLQTDFASKTMEDCETFIETSQSDKENIQLAIVDDSDEYMGTVSLKHITASDAEFAIAVRKSAMGKGYSQYGMKEIIRYGFDNLELESIYWCVSPENKRALCFYDKNGYERMKSLKARGGYSPEQTRHYIWYKAERRMHREESQN